MDPEQDRLVFNGISGVTGLDLQEPMTSRELALRLLGRKLPEEQDEPLRADLSWRRGTDVEQHLAVEEGVDPTNLAETGWGVIFRADADPAVRVALSELLAYRREQAGVLYKEFVGRKGYSPGMSKNRFLINNGAAPGPVVPTLMPYYLLIVGSPEEIPFGFQYQLDVEHAVGRVHFERPDGSEDLEAYASYAHSVVEAERGAGRRPRRAVFVGVRTEGDEATQRSAEDLVRPLADFVRAQQTGWDVSDYIGPEQATKPRLKALLGGADTPGVLFWAGHGVGFPNGHPLQIPNQGALLCQEWPGRGAISAGGKLTEEYYLSAGDIEDSADLLGLLAFQFACYGAGTPRSDQYAHLSFAAPKEIAARSFVARLPQRLLGHPKGGALAVVGHVERAWTCSFRWGNRPALAVFEGLLLRLLAGKPIGLAMEYFNGRYAELASDLTALLQEYRWETDEDQIPHLEIAKLFLNQNDARAYVIVGDPAVRLAVDDGAHDA